MTYLILAEAPGSKWGVCGWVGQEDFIGGEYFLKSAQSVQNFDKFENLNLIEIIKFGLPFTIIICHYLGKKQEGLISVEIFLFSIVVQP